MENPIKPRHFVIGASLRTPKWHNIGKRNNMLLSLCPHSITKLIHRMGKWLAWNRLDMAKLPQHPLWMIRFHTNPTSDEARGKKNFCAKGLTSLWFSYGHHTTTSICSSSSLSLTRRAVPILLNGFHLVATEFSTTQSSNSE